MAKLRTPGRTDVLFTFSAMKLGLVSGHLAPAHVQSCCPRHRHRQAWTRFERDNDIVLVPHLAISLEQVREDGAVLGRDSHAPSR